MNLETTRHNRPEDLPPFRRVIELAWEAHINGNIGVGAVLTNVDGEPVAEGRNRVCDSTAPAGHLHDTFLAHAEIDVLGQLKPGDYRDHVMWSSLEPCPLCSTAIVMSNIGRVDYAAGDILWEDIGKLSQVNSFMKERWPLRRQTLFGPWSLFCEMLPILWFLKNKPEGTVIRAYAKRKPDLLEAARKASFDDRFRSGSLTEAAQGVWPELQRLDVEQT